ncbi:hypothetical protein KPL71_002154 [Citrus sinensis]|uniref:Uncharacterized protein n=1 Tax=Citrus sinensis TaxID=2711 RepID=A0ACB8P2A6_CITSI|nr:hypothetical protein KPL71_002154 [Citrus sinensis]
MKDAHVVEIPVDEEHQQKVLCCMNTTTAIQHHPLMEISQSPGHLLLLKLWQREEDLFGRRISLKESRMDSSKREIFQLCCFFLVFHGFFLTLLFTSSFKLYRYWKVCRQLQREKNDNRALTRCIQELRMKGASFDLSKEPLSGKRMKSSSVEIKWKPLTWCSQNVITICLLCFSDSAFPPLKLKRDSRKTKAFKLRHCEAISLCLRQSRSAPMREAVSLPISYLVPSIMNYEVV